MLDLRDLIIDRIQQAQNLQTSQIQHSIRDSTDRSVPQTSRMTLKQFSQVKKQQKARVKQQQSLLDQIKSLRFYHSNVAENFYGISLSIFSTHDPAVLSLLTSGQTTDERLQQLYRYFIASLPKKQKPKQSGITPNIEVLDSNPFILLSWVSEWSRNLLTNKLQASMEEQFQQKKQSRMVSLTKSNIPNRDKSPNNHLTLSSHTNKQEDTLPPKIVFTNKQSVYSYFLENLNLYYKSLPLDVDFNFLKSIRKAFGKTNQFERQDNLQRAAEILIETKNKNTKEQVELFRKEFYNKYPKKLKTCIIQYSREPSPFKAHKKNQKQDHKFFERIKSETKQEEQRKKSQQNNRNSYLLCPKTNEINFESSKDMVRKMHKEKPFELPEIFPHRMAQVHSKSTANRNKPFGCFLAPTSNSIVGIDDIKNTKIGSKFIDIKHPLGADKLVHRKNNNSSIREDESESIQNPEKSRKEGDDFKRNRKLMLQLLRQKNRYAFLER